jgi:cytochrome c biogenesis protein ResB
MMRFIKALASLKLTLVGMVLLGLASIAIFKLEHNAAPWLAVPLMLLGLNLMAAVATNGVFRRNTPLLVFHLALITIVLLAAAGRLTYLNGTAEVTEGETFSGLKESQAGPLHPWRIDKVQFVNEGMDIDYTPGPVRVSTVSRVRWLDAQGRERRGEARDNTPLVLLGYHFNVTANKGFAPVLLWQPTVGEPVLGAVHLPSYPAQVDAQATTWRPGAVQEDIWLMLAFKENLIPADRASRFSLPKDRKLVVRHREARWEMQPGERVSLPDGVLEYQELRTWMGYQVYYDWTVPWLLAASVVAVLSLASYFWRKYASTPWNDEN